MIVIIFYFDQISNFIKRKLRYSHFYLKIKQYIRNGKYLQRFRMNPDDLKDQTRQMESNIETITKTGKTNATQIKKNNETISELERQISEL